MEFNSIGEFAEYHKEKELKYYNDAIERIEKIAKPLFLKAFNHNLPLGELQLLQRQLQQAIAAYEYGEREDKFCFAVLPNLKESLSQKCNSLIQDLKRALNIVETKLQHFQPFTNTSKNKDLMRIQDFFFIIIHGIYDHPNFLVNHLRRELNKAKENGYDELEFEHGINEVLLIIEGKIENIFQKEVKTYEDYQLKDKELPKGEKYNYPKPERGEILISEIVLPDGVKHILPKAISLKETSMVSEALNELKINPNGEALKLEDELSTKLTLNERVLNKTDFIRLINVLAELRAFKLDNGQYPEKKDIVAAFSKLIGNDLKSFYPDLNKAYEKSEDANTKIFDTLKNKAVELWEEKNYK